MRPRLLMVARGNNRNNGSNLGIAYLNANNALSNSNGNNWRSRPTFTPCAATRTGEVLGSKPEIPHKATRPREMRGAVKNVIKDDWQVFPTSSRRVKICGFALHAARPPRLYRGIWRRTRRSFCVFSAHPTKRLYLSLMSRKGWLMAINKHFSPVFKLPNGGYLWQAK